MKKLIFILIINISFLLAVDKEISENKFNLYIPKKILCTDNAAMIAWAAIEKYKFSQKNNFYFEPLPRWAI